MNIAYRLKYAAFLAGVSLTCAAHSEVENAALPATSGWMVREAGNACTASRRFGTEERPVLLRFSQAHLDNGVEIALSGYPVETMARDTDATVSFEPEPSMEAGTPLFAQNTRYGATMIFPSRDGGGREVRVPEPEAAKGVRRVAIATGAMSVVLETGDMTEPLSTLRKCVDDLYARWGVDPAMKEKIAQWPIPRDALAMASDANRHFPKELLKMGKEGRVPFVAIVDAKGMPIGCYVVQSYADARFNDPVCNAVLRARFKPALDKAGQPVTWIFRGATSFML